MPARGARQLDLRAETSQASSTSPSESEESFVSAELENTNARVPGDAGQSAPARAPPAASSSSSSSRREGHKASTATSSTASTSPVRTDRKTNGRFNVAQKDLATTPSGPLSPPTGSYFTAQPGSTSIEPRSPAQRRPPASRSSHGIETISGPPPALSTQRSYNAESPWRNPPPTDPAVTPKPIPQRTETDDSIDSVLKIAQSATHDRRYSESSKTASSTRPRSLCWQDICGSHDISERCTIVGRR